MLHQATPTPRWTNHSFIWHIHLSTVHAHRMGTSNVPIQPLLTVIWGRTVVAFWWFWGWETSDTRLARQKLGKKTHPNHGGRHRHMAAMVPPPRRRCIHQSANILCDKSMSLKLKNIIVLLLFISYVKSRRIVDTLCRCACVCQLRQMMKSGAPIGLINRIGCLELIRHLRCMGFQEMNS